MSAQIEVILRTPAFLMGCIATIEFTYALRNEAHHFGKGISMSIVKPLPESLALEALHFVEYLSSKNADRVEMSDLAHAQEIVMKHVWDNQDDTVWNDVEKL